MFSNPIFLTGAIAIALLLFFKLTFYPIRLLWKVICNGLLGWLVLVLLNSLTPWTGLSIPINFWIACGIGFFGLPGLVALVIYVSFLG